MCCWCDVFNVGLLDECVDCEEWVDFVVVDDYCVDVVGCYELVCVVFVEDCCVVVCVFCVEVLCGCYFDFVGCGLCIV